jgi:hypothetical protein
VVGRPGFQEGNVFLKGPKAQESEKGQGESWVYSQRPQEDRHHDPPGFDPGPQFVPVSLGAYPGQPPDGGCSP